MSAILRALGHVYSPEIDIAVVTGGASGLGKEIVAQLALLGGTVVVLDIIKVPRNQRLKGVCYYQVDITNYASLIKCQKYVHRNIGAPTVLINNAAIAKQESIMNMSTENISKTVAVNLTSHFFTTKVFLPAMISAKRGYIVTVSSVLAFSSPTNFAAYGAAKSGLLAFHESLTYELGPPSQTCIKTLLLCPGQLKTALFEEIRNPSPILAPSLDVVFVGRLLVTAMQAGRRGDIKVPIYGNYLPFLRFLPWYVVEVARSYAGIDQHSSDATV